MKKIIITLLSLLTIVFVTLFAIDKYKDFKQKELNKKIEESIVNTKKSFKNNKYLKIDSDHWENENEYWLNDDNNNKRFGFYANGNSYFSKCDIGSEYSNCITYNWEKDTGIVAYCRYDVKNNKVIYNSFCSDFEKQKIQTFKQEFLDELKKLNIEISNLKYLID